MIEGQTPNTAELANLLPLDTDRQDMREQWLRRLLKNPLLSSMEVLEPWARQALAAAGQNGQTIILSMDQTDGGDRFALLMVSLGVGDRALPLAWTVEAGPANLGFNAQHVLLERVRTWLPAGAEVLLSADRFYPSVALFEWLHAQPDWHYRLRLKGNLNVDPGVGDIVTTGKLAAGQTERYLPDVRLFDHGVSTHLAIWREPGYPEPWIIAMNDPPNRATVRDYASRWGIEIDQPYHLHKSHLVVMIGMARGPSGGARCLDLFQISRIGLDQPERTGGMGNLATPQSAAPQPGEQGRLRHVQAVGQLGEGPLVGATMGNRRRRGRGAQPQAGFEVADHGGVEGFAAFGRMPALGVQLLGNGRGTMPRRMQHRHPGPSTGDSS